MNLAGRELPACRLSRQPCPPSPLLVPAPKEGSRGRLAATANSQEVQRFLARGISK